MRGLHWTVAKASCQGTKNRARHKPCQDRARYALMERTDGGDTLIAAAADGMGSADRGGHGAGIAAQRSVARISEIIWKTGRTDPANIETALNAGALQARMDIERAAERAGQRLELYATTLLLLVQTGGIIGALQIGDGAAVVGTAGGRHTLAKPVRGEYANETSSLTGHGAIQKATVTIAAAPEPIREIALMTDGVVGISLDAASLEPHDPFFDGMFSWLAEHDGQDHPNRELCETLGSEAVARKTDDDVTLILAVRRDG